MSGSRESRWAIGAAFAVLVVLIAGVELWTLLRGGEEERLGVGVVSPADTGRPGDGSVWSDPTAPADNRPTARGRIGDGFVLFLFDPPYEVVWSGPSTCTGLGQLCDTAASIDFDVPAQRSIRITVAAPPVHCSSVRYHLSLNDDSALKTRFMRFDGATGHFARLPAEESVDLGVLPAGTHSLTVVSEGQISGCNTGEFHSASVFLDFPEGIDPKPAVFVDAEGPP